MNYKVIVGLLILLVLAYVSGLCWDVYVFIESTRMFLKGIDPYMFSNDPRAYTPGLGPMWIAYPPLPLYIWSIFVAPLVWFNVPLNALYVFAIKLPSIIALVLSSYIVYKMNGNWKWVLFNPISIAIVFIHGMFDSIVAFLLLLSIVLLNQRREVSSGIAYGLALATKQHALLAAIPFLAYFLKRRDIKGLVAFTLSSLIVFAIVIISYVSIFDFHDLKEVLDTIFLFHTKRPPNSLGFGGFAVLNFYGDTLGKFAGNTAVALYMGGTTVELSKIIDKVTLLALPVFLLAAAFDLIEGVFISYMDYILLSYVGAVQHLVIPSVLAGVVLSSKDEKRKKLMTIFFVVTLLYALEHIISFWEFFPMIVSPLFLKQFGMWSAELSRQADIALANWDLVLRLTGIVLTTLAIVFLMIFIVSYHKKMLPRFKSLWIIIPSLYILEIVMLGLLMHGITSSSPSQNVINTNKWCLLLPWENTEYPGYKFGDYLSPYSVPPPQGYYSYVKPVAEKFVRSIKGKCNLALAVRLDLFREYQYTDLIDVIINNGVKYAWVLILDPSQADYIYGISSTPSISLNRTFNTVLANIPLKGYFQLGGIMGFMNTLFHFIKPKSYEGYFTVDNRPVIFVISKSEAMLKEVKELAKLHGVVILPFRGHVLNIRGVALSIAST